MLKSVVFIGFLTLFNFGSFAQQKTYTLKECIDRAWTGHPQIKSLEQGVNINVEQLEQLKAASQPSLFFNASQNLNMGRSIDPFTYQFTNEKIFSNNFSLNTNVTLFSGFKYVRSRDQQSVLIEASKENIAKVKNDVALSIANQYLQVILLKQQLILLDTQIAITGRQMHREELLLSNGKSNENKILQLKAQQLSEQNRKFDVSSNLQNALITLQFASAINEEGFDVQLPDLNSLNNNSENYTLTSVLQEAEKNMASVKFQKLNEDYYFKGIDVSRAGYYPTLTLTGNISSGYSSARKQTSFSTVFVDQPIGYLFSTPSEMVYGPVGSNTITQEDYPFGLQVKDNFSQFIGLNLRVPIFNNRNNKTALQVARINYEKSRIETELVMLNLQKDITTAYAAYQNSGIKHKNNRELQSLQEEILFNQEKIYKNGNISVYELLNQKNLVYQAQSAVLQSEYELIFRKLVLDYYSGKPLNL